MSVTDQRDSLAAQAICAAELDESSRSKIRKSLQLEHELEEEPEFEPITYLKVAELPLRGHDTHVKGEISEFLDRRVPEGRFPIVRVYRVLMDDIRRRNNYNRQVNTFLELVEQKSIGPTEFERILEDVCAQRDPDRVWRDIETRLHSEQMNLSTIHRLRTAWLRLEVRRMNPADSHLRTVMDTIARCVSQTLENENVTNLSDLLIRVLDRFRALPVEGEAFGDDDIRVIALAKQYDL